VVTLPLPALQQLAASTVDHPQRARPTALEDIDLQRLVERLHAHDVPALRR
jgi:hypothetical protein